jgi:hypothetical protein
MTTSSGRKHAGPGPATDQPPVPEPTFAERARTCEDVGDGCVAHVKGDCVGKYFCAATITDGELMQLEIILEPIGAKPRWDDELSG